MDSLCIIQCTRHERSTRKLSSAIKLNGLKHYQNNTQNNHNPRLEPRLALAACQSPSSSSLSSQRTYLLVPASEDDGKGAVSQNTPFLELIPLSHRLKHGKSRLWKLKRVPILLSAYCRGVYSPCPPLSGKSESSLCPVLHRSPHSKATSLIRGGWSRCCLTTQLTFGACTVHGGVSPLSLFVISLYTPIHRQRCGQSK